jgi:hypothetical protein
MSRTNNGSGDIRDDNGERSMVFIREQNIFFVTFDFCTTQSSFKKTFFAFF